MTGADVPPGTVYKDSLCLQVGERGKIFLCHLQPLPLWAWGKQTYNEVAKQCLVCPALGFVNGEISHKGKFRFLTSVEKFRIPY